MDKNSFSVCHWTQAFFSWWSPISYFVCKQDVVLGWFLRHPCTIQIPDHSGTGNLVQMITVLQTIGNLHRCFWAVFKAHSWRILSGCDWFCFHNFSLSSLHSNLCREQGQKTSAISHLSKGERNFSKKSMNWTKTFRRRWIKGMSNFSNDRWNR